MTPTYFLILLSLPVLAGMLFAKWKFQRRIHWWEAIGGVGVAGAAAGICLLLGSYTYRADVETHSGAVNSAHCIPEWVSKESGYTTDKKGRRHSYTYYETHPTKCWVDTEVGDLEITYEQWGEIRGKFERTLWTEKGRRPNFHKGNDRDYHMELDSPNDPTWPAYAANETFTWDNYLSQTDSIVTTAPMSDREAKALNLPDYPAFYDVLESRRLVGYCNVDYHKWDQMNARLGPSKHVNVIMAALGKQHAIDRAEQLQRWWRNGKKNDLVICLDDPYAPSWCYVFGWAKDETIKFDLQADIMNAGKVDNGIIPVIEASVKARFVPYEWQVHKDTGPPVSTNCLWLAFFAVCASSVGYYWWAVNNDIEESSSYGRRFR